jgi:hypothetical protein
VSAPLLTAETVLREVEAGACTRFQLAESFDIDPSNFTLRRIVLELRDYGLVTLSDDSPGVDDWTVRPVKRGGRRAA